MDELIFAGNKYISSRRAGKIAGYTTDYLGQLCRADKINCRFVGRNWYINERDIERQKKSFKKEQMQGVRRVEYSKIELEPMYYSNDERFNNVQINKTLKVEDGVEEPIAIVEDKSNDKEELISVLRMVESPTIDLRGANRKVIVRPSHRVIERRGLALQKAPIRFPMVRVLASVVIIVGLLLVAGTLTLQQSLKYVSSDKTDINKKLQLANVASFFNF